MNLNKCKVFYCVYNIRTIAYSIEVRFHHIVMRTLTTMLFIGAQKGTSMIDNGFKACMK